MNENISFLKKENEFKLQLPILKDRKVFRVWKEAIFDYLGSKQLTHVLKFKNIFHVHVDKDKPMFVERAASETDQRRDMRTPPRARSPRTRGDHQRAQAARTDGQDPPIVLETASDAGTPIILPTDTGNTDIHEPIPIPLP